MVSEIPTGEGKLLTFFYSVISYSSEDGLHSTLADFFIYKMTPANMKKRFYGRRLPKRKEINF
jgi:hypothetical protein